jgi:cell division protein ZapE
VGITALYAEELRNQTLKPDRSQDIIVKKLEDLQHRLQQDKPAGLVKRLLSGTQLVPVRGLYIHGPVGSGKTMLMDMFFKTVEGLPKRRIHFHAFMQEVHARRSALKSDDVINTIADGIAANAKLLCMDEMQIADAMIIGRLFEALQSRGVCFVTTSNVPPESLYKDGLNRQLFLPFIAKLRASLDVVLLDSPTDYRLNRFKSHETFITPLGAASTARLNQLWQNLTDVKTGEPLAIDVLGRKLHVPHAARGCARFSFSDLCERPLGPPDYLALAATFRTVFIDNIPVLKTGQRNEAKRFVLMIDTFYDARTRLVATAAQQPENLYPKGQHGFEFARTISRLKEMQSASWWGKSIPDT